jgi:aromatic-L-amino-acid decarboxylase
LKKQIIKDAKDGYIPFFVCATIGTTSSNAIDSVYEIGKICDEYKLWMHVDAAMAGTATLCPEYQYMHKGLEYADSYTFNPHKWMLTNFDCSCLFIKNRDELISALRIMPEYLNNQSSKSGEVIDYRDWQIPLGRRFRSLKLWAVIRYYGIEGLQNYVRHHINMAQQFLSWVKSDERFEIMAPAPLNLICFRVKGSNKLNEDLLNHINNTGEIYITHTRLNDLFTLRLCVGQTHTDVNHVKEAWELIKSGIEKIKG